MAAKQKQASAASQKAEQQNGNDVYRLPEYLTIETVEAALSELAGQPLPRAATWRTDASALQSITTPGLQLLLSLQKTLAAQESDLVIEGVREQVADIFRDMGLAAWLRPSA